jgi:hypothetical protein
MEENMKISKTMIAALAITFLASNCILFGDTSSTDDGGGTTSYVSDGSWSSPVSITYGVNNYGEVDGTNDSYYVLYYGTGFFNVYLYNLTNDVDLYTFGDDSYFSVSDDFSGNTGTADEYCYTYTATGYVYIGVDSYYATGGGSYDIYVY